MRILLMEFLTLSIYTLFMGFCFCDGFKLHIMRKIIWNVVFLAICIYTFRIKNAFDLTFILPVPTLLAILLCNYEKRKSQKAKKCI